GIERPLGLERERLHLLIVVMLEAAAVVMVMGVPMIMAVRMFVTMVMIVIAVMIVAATVEEFRLDLEDAVEIEGVALQHLREPDAATLGLVQLGVWVDAADAGLDLAELVGLHQVGLVEQDD